MLLFVRGKVDVTYCCDALVSLVIRALTSITAITTDSVLACTVEVAFSGQSLIKLSVKLCSPSPISVPITQSSEQDNHSQSTLRVRPTINCRIYNDALTTLHTTHLHNIWKIGNTCRFFSSFLVVKEATKSHFSLMYR